MTVFLSFSLPLYHILIDHLQFLGLAITGTLGSDGSEGPPLLTATIRNSYSSLGVRSGTVAEVLPAGTVMAGSQLKVEGVGWSFFFSKF